MSQTARSAVAAALLVIYWAKLMRGLNTCFSAAVCGASFYIAETNAKNPAGFYNSVVIASSWPSYPIILEEQRNKENEGRGEIPAARGSSVSRHLQQLPALGGLCRWAETERLCNRGELCQVLSPDTSQTTSMAPASEEEKQQGHAWVMVLMTGEFLAGSCGAERFPLPEHYGKSCSQLSISFQFLTSLQNRRSQHRGVFWSNSSHAVLLTDPLWTRSLGSQQGPG